ncbi:iron-containing alcohol dehydrogenase [Puteibacter caeruleilacunae]|nr:iron-containing alcohol dehydrogenase [Puteibacter caeruleilacunae]
MDNFVFHNPVKVLFGKGETAKLSRNIPKDSKILLTYGGGSIKKNGVYDQVMAALEGYDITEFSGIEPNPHYETLMKAVEIIKEKSIDFILAVGGGSVIDGSKFVAAAVHFDGEPWDILAKAARVTKAVPLGAVLTLPATGSEMNGNSVVTKWETKEKLAFGSPMVMPQFSVLDPETIYSLPIKQVSNGIADAFIHVLEQYLTYPVNAPIQDRFAEGIMQTLVEEGPKVLANQKDYDAAANFMWAATMALNGLIAAGVPQDWATHMIGHELTAFHGIDHGQTLAIVMPAMMQYKRDVKGDKIVQFAQRVWNINEDSRDATIDAAIAKTKEFFETIGLKTSLSEVEVGTETIDKIEKRFEGRGFNIGENADITPADIKGILELCS